MYTMIRALDNLFMYITAFICDFAPPCTLRNYRSRDVYHVGVEANAQKHFRALRADIQHARSWQHPKDGEKHFRASRTHFT